MAEFIQPPALVTTDVLHIVAPAGPIQKESLEDGALLLPFSQHRSANLFERFGYLAGPHMARQNDLQQALNDAQSSAIFCARGGFGTSELLDEIDFTSFMQHPKWVIGSSDITSLLVHLWAFYRLLTIHGPMAATVHKSQKDAQHLSSLLTNPDMSFELSLRPLVSGQATGPLLGGNLTVLAHMVGTFPIESFAGAILFIEDVTEAPYRIERCLVQLKRCGILSQVSGIILGEFTQCIPGQDGVSVETVLTRNLMPLNIPIAADYPAAHGKRNRPFIHGREMSLRVTDATARLSTLD